MSVRPYDLVTDPTTGNRVPPQWCVATGGIGYYRNEHFATIEQAEARYAEHVASYHDAWSRTKPTRVLFSQTGRIDMRIGYILKESRWQYIKVNRVPGVDYNLVRITFIGDYDASKRAN